MTTAGNETGRGGPAPRPARLALAATALTLAAFLAAGCGTIPGSVDSAPAHVSGHPATSMIDKPSLPSASVAARELAALPSAARVTPTSRGYRRSAFGSSWIDTDDNGCNQRDDVLLRDGVPSTVLVVEQGACDHDVVAGSWVDPYTGKQLRFDDLKDPVQARAVQIDHVVPLGEAWVSGADAWTAARRERFANDLAELLAVDGPTNDSKSDGDPAAWRPRKDFQCTYALRWISVKSTWSLAVDTSERRALVDMLGTCAS